MKRLSLMPAAMAIAAFAAPPPPEPKPDWGAISEAKWASQPKRDRRPAPLAPAYGVDKRRAKRKASRKARKAAR